jgi:hypothetical protein
MAILRGGASVRGYDNLVLRNTDDDHSAEVDLGFCASTENGKAKKNGTSTPFHRKLHNLGLDGLATFAASAATYCSIRPL